MVYINLMATAALRSSKGKSRNNMAVLISELTTARDQIDRLLRKAQAAMPEAVILNRKAARASALDNIKTIVSATEMLRTSGGNLSVEPIAKLYGVSLSRVACWLGRTRQAVAKTPDADSLQESLALFERVARLIVVVSPEEFRKWLRMPNESLAGKRPLDLLTSEDGQVVADLVDDMLTGAPV